MRRRTVAAVFVTAGLIAASCSAAAGSTASHFSEADGPIEWVWDAEKNPDAYVSEAFREGPDCYGSSDPPNASTKEVRLRDATLSVSVGLHVAPEVVYTNRDGITDLSNPFGDRAWVCSVATDGSMALAVGSSVWWSGDGITWSVIDAFEVFSGSNVDGSDLVWSAIGPLGYIVLGAENRDGWYSQDLETWHRIPGAGPSYTSRGWYGPGNVTISDQTIVIGSGNVGAWIGTPRSESGTG
jgi:hypothetical protein